MRAQTNSKQTERQSWEHLATDTKATPMHRALALAHMKQSKAQALNLKGVQILHDAQ